MTDDAALVACEAFFADAEKNGVYRLFAPAPLETFAHAYFSGDLDEAAHREINKATIHFFETRAPWPEDDRSALQRRWLALVVEVNARADASRPWLDTTAEASRAVAAHLGQTSSELDSLDRSAIMLNARTAPTRPDRRDANKAQLHREVNEHFVALGEQMGDVVLQAPVFKPGEPDDRYFALVATAAAQYGPPEWHELNRFDMHASQLAVEAKADLENLARGIERPCFSLRPDELRVVTNTDSRGRPMTEFYSRRGPWVWMDAFADPVRRYVSGPNETDAGRSRAGALRVGLLGHLGRPPPLLS